MTRIDLEYAFPAFTGMAPRHEEDGGDIFGPAGTTVTIRVHTDKPVRRGAVALEGGTALPLKAEAQEATTLVAGLTIAPDGAYRIGLEDIDGLASPERHGVLRPRPRRSSARRPHHAAGRRSPGDQARGGRGRGARRRRSRRQLARARLRREGARREGGAVPARRRCRRPASTGTHTLFIEDLDVEPGDFVTYYARARDIGRGKVSTEARSDIFFLEVRPFSEQFFAAQSQAMAGGGGGAAGRSARRRRRRSSSATWKLHAARHRRPVGQRRAARSPRRRAS